VGIQASVGQEWSPGSEERLRVPERSLHVGSVSVNLEWSEGPGGQDVSLYLGGLLSLGWKGKEAESQKERW
jgi:hypothetical protein